MRKIVNVRFEKVLVWNMQRSDGMNRICRQSHSPGGGSLHPSIKN